MLDIFHSWPSGRSMMSLQWFGTKFDTLGRIAAEILVILYVHPLFFSEILSLISKIFNNIHENVY